MALEAEMGIKSGGVGRAFTVPTAAGTRTDYTSGVEADLATATAGAGVIRGELEGVAYVWFFYLDS